MFKPSSLTYGERSPKDVTLFAKETNNKLNVLDHLAKPLAKSTCLQSLSHQHVEKRMFETSSLDYVQGSAKAITLFARQTYNKWIVLGHLTLPSSIHSYQVHPVPCHCLLVSQSPSLSLSLSSLSTFLFYSQQRMQCKQVKGCFAEKTTDMKAVC